MLGRSSGNHDWLLANASGCVSCGFRLRNARNASDCVWMETGLKCRVCSSNSTWQFTGAFKAERRAASMTAVGLQCCQRQRLRSASRQQLLIPRHRLSTFGRRVYSRPSLSLVQRSATLFQSVSVTRRVPRTLTVNWTQVYDVISA